MDKEELKNWLYQNFVFVTAGVTVDLVPITDIAKMIDEEFKRNYSRPEMVMYLTHFDCFTEPLIVFLSKFYGVHRDLTIETLLNIYQSIMYG
jgi:hypothetical protein